VHVGLIADTHDLVRPELLDALAGVDAILHAGDVCSAPILDALAELAPVTAVRGNNDDADLADRLPEARAIDLGGVRVWMLHDRTDLDRLPQPVGTDLVLVGHSHRPLREDLGAYTLVDPGSPGRRRFTLPVSCARLTVDGSHWAVEFTTLDVPPPRRRKTRR
jgi:putative phosphoesterase